MSLITLLDSSREGSLESYQHCEIGVIGLGADDQDLRKQRRWNWSMIDNIVIKFNLDFINPM